MPKRLSTIGLHCDLKNGSIPADDANTVVLLCLMEHSQQLMGYDPVQSRYGHHGYYKGQKCIYLVMEEAQWYHHYSLAFDLVILFHKS